MTTATKEQGAKSQDSDKKVTVIVSYTGHVPFEDEFSANASLSSVKARAINKFGLEPSAALKYGLQFNGADVPDNAKVKDLGTDPVKLTLVFLQDQTKG